MILDEAGAARKVREQQEEEERQRRQQRRQYNLSAFPVAQETSLSAPPAYQPNPSASSAAVQTVPPLLTINHGAQPQLARQLQHRASGNPESGLQPQPPRNGGSPRKRFFKAFVVALLIYTLVGSFIASVFDSGVGYRRGEIPEVDIPWGKPAVPWVSDGAIVPKHGCETASFEEMVQVVPWSDVDRAGFQALSHRDSDDYAVKGSGPYQATSLFTIPSAEVKNFYVVSRGAHAKGIFYFREGDVENVQIEIAWEYWQKGLVNSVNMCMLEHNTTSKGFGIFTPTVDWDWMPAHQRFVTFNVIVRMPRQRDSQISILRSHLENFNQSVISSHRQWDNIALHGSNGAILADGTLSARQLSLTTANARIEGSFFAESSLSIETSNAPIDVKVELLNEHDAHPTTANLITTNAVIHSTWQLSALRYHGSSSWPGYGGSFDISAETTNGVMRHTMTVAPIQPKIKFAARTTDAASAVSLYRTFEGSWELKSNQSPEEVNVTADFQPEDDPEKRHREPSLRVYSYNRGIVEGAFSWERAKRLGGQRDDERLHTRTEDSRDIQDLSDHESFAEVTATNGKLWLSFI